jgi:hypothetical protein
MTRAERRRLSKGKINMDELQEIINDRVMEAIAYTVRQYSAVVALCLRDKLGFGKTRAQRFMKDVDTMFGDVMAGYLTLDDVIETVEKELDITI